SLSGPTLIVIDPSQIKSLYVNNQQVTAANVVAFSGSIPGLPGEGSTENFITSNAGIISGFTQGDLAINGVPSKINIETSPFATIRYSLNPLVDNGTPSVNLQNFQQGSSQNGGGGG